jgi:prevent-host-death family protein
MSNISQQTSQKTSQKERSQKTVSSSEAQNQFGELVSWIVSNRGEVVVKRRGEPEIAMMPFSEYEEAKKLREQERRREAFERLKRVRERVQARVKDTISEEEALQIGDDLAREAIGSLVEKGKIRFEA